jgi:hypothetical protein
MGLAFDEAVKTFHVLHGGPPDSGFSKLEVEQETWFDNIDLDGQYMTVKFGFSNIDTWEVEIDTDNRQIVRSA